MVSIESMMSRDVLQARADESVAGVVARMSEAEVGAVVVVDGDHGLAGVFSERDLLHRVVAAGRDPAATEVGSVATRNVVSVAPGTSLRECAETLRKHEVRHLPVVESGKVVGMVSARDFFRAVASELESYIERARYEEELRQDVDPYDHLGGSYGR